MEYGRDDNDEFGGPPVGLEILELERARKTMLQNYHNIARSEATSRDKGIILDSINDAYVKVKKKYNHVLN